MLVVESNERSIVRTMGEITGEFGPGSQNLNTPNSGVMTAFKRMNYGGNAPWLVEAFFFSMARFEGVTTGISQSKQLIPMEFEVAYYFRVKDPKLLMHNVQMHGDAYTTVQLGKYISPFIDQAISQIVNLIPVEEIYLKLQDLTMAVNNALTTHMSEIGVELLYTRVRRIEPKDELLRRVVQIRGFESGEIEEIEDEAKAGQKVQVPQRIDDMQAIRVALAEVLARNGDPGAVNMMLGVPYYNVAVFGSGLPGPNGSSMPQPKLPSQSQPPSS